MDFRTSPASRPDRVSFRQPLGHGGLETLAAHYVRQAFKPHAHPEYLIGVITGGMHAVWCRGERHSARPGTVMSMRPGDVHHGKAAGSEGWVQRMFYVSEATMAELLGDRRDGAAVSLPDFDRCSRENGALAARLARIHATLHGAAPRLARDVAWAGFADVVSLLAGGGSGGEGAPRGLPDPRGRRLVDFLHAHVGEDVSLGVLAALAGLGRRQTIDLFKRQTGLPPHAYHLGLKVRLVQERLRAGTPTAAAAMEAGFADQSHMTRHFSAIVGMTPAAYALSGRNRTFVLEPARAAP